MPELLDTDVGPLWYPAGDFGVTSYVSQHGCWEPEKGAVIRSKLRPGSQFVDVGAHVGYFSVMASKLVGPEGGVVCVEPLYENCALLARNLESLTNVLMIEGAAWNQRCFLELYPSSVNSGDNRLWDHHESGSPQKTMAFPLDELGIQVLDLMKVDAQASDQVVLAGAERTIQRCRPAIIVEFWPEGLREHGYDPFEVLKFYEDLKYEWTVIGGEPLPMEAGYCDLLLEPR